MDWDFWLFVTLIILIIGAFIFLEKFLKKRYPALKNFLEPVRFSKGWWDTVIGFILFWGIILYFFRDYELAMVVMPLHLWGILRAPKRGSESN
jgi:uncharacterized sodium:solute symporter family permease YidK